MKIQLLLNLLDDKIDIMNLSNKTTILELKNIIKNKYNYSDIYLKGDTLLKSNLSLDKNYIYSNDTIYINKRLKGGFIDILIKMLTGIVKLLKNLGSLIDDLIGIIVNIFEMIPAIFSPDKLINDIIYAMSLGITSMIEGFIKNLPFGGGGKTKDEEGGKGIFGMGKDAKKVCIKPTFLNLIILVLCPPLALFLKRGMKGIFWVLVCGLMTYFLYYFPGLIFAALHIFC